MRRKLFNSMCLGDVSRKPHVVFRHQVSEMAKTRAERLDERTSPHIMCPACEKIAGVAQLVERYLAKVTVEGSSPFTRSL